HPVAARVEVQAADDRDHGGVPGGGDLGGRQQGGGGHAEKGDEGAALAAEIHVRQVVHGDALAQVADQAPHAVVAADQVYPVEAAAPLAHDLVHIGIALARVHR